MKKSSKEPRLRHRQCVFGFGEMRLQMQTLLQRRGGL
jgi:hypothetical protein